MWLRTLASFPRLPLAQRPKRRPRQREYLQSRPTSSSAQIALFWESELEKKDLKAMEDLASLSFVADLERENLVLRDEVLKLKLRIAELLAAQRESLSRDLMAMSDVDDEQKILSLNVGGTIFATLRSTLLQHEGTFFEVRISLLKEIELNAYVTRTAGSVQRATQ